MNKLRITIATALIMASGIMAYAAGISVSENSSLNIGASKMNIAGDVTIKGSVILSTGTVNVTGKWTNTGTFTAGTSTVNLRGSGQSDITGNNTFFILNIDTFTDGAKTVRFGAGETQTIQNSFVITGHVGKTLTIRSTIDGSVGTINIPATILNNVDFVNVKDSAVDGVKTITAGSSSFDAGNNVNWIFNTTDEAEVPANKYVCVTPNVNSVKDLAGNPVANTAVCTAVTIPTAPTAVSFTAIGGTVLPNTLNNTNTNFTASASITAGDATGGSAELLIGGASFATPIMDNTIGGADTSVTFDAGFILNSEVQTAFATSAALSVKLTDSSGNTIESSVANPTILVDYIAPSAPTGATIVAGDGWNTDYITSVNQTAVKVSGSKSTDTVKIVIDIDDEDAFLAAKTATLPGLGTGTTYADTTGIDVTSVSALSDGAIAIRITASDLAGNTSTQTVLTGAAAFNKDAIVPTISSVTLSPSSGSRMVGDTVDITVTAGGNENGLIPSTAIFNGQAVTLTGAGGGTYTGTYTVAEGHNDATNAEANFIVLTDAAGNYSSVGASSGNTVTIDANTPTGSMTGIAPSSGTKKIGDTITITATADIGIFDCGTDTVDDGDGKTYNTIVVGSQCWMATNLEYDYDNAGTGQCTDVTWVNSSDEGWCGYYTGGPFTDEGYLYQWSAAMNGSTSEGAQGVCPAGWHIPTHDEFKILEGTVDSLYKVGNVEWDGGGARGNDVGTQLRVSGASGFEGILTGNRNADGNIVNRGSFEYWWTSTESSSTAQTRLMNVSNTKSSRGFVDKSLALSVRCVKDNVNANGSLELNLTLSGTINGKTGTNAINNGNGTYSIDYVIVEGDAERTSGTLPASLVFTDLAGNITSPAMTSVPANTIIVDSVRPTLSPVTIASDNANTARAKIGDTVTLSFTVSEDIQNPPTATIDGNAAAIGGSNPNWTATYTMTSSGTEGVIPFTIDFTDTAGNVGVQVTATTDASTVTFDKTAPTLTNANISITSTPSGVGGVYITGDTVTVQWDNTLASGDGNVDILSAEVDFSVFGGPSNVAMANASEFWTASYVIVAGTNEANNVNIAVTATDTTGNFTVTGDTSNLDLDNRKPTLTLVRIISNNAVTSEAKIGDIVTVSFTTSESIQNPPTVTIAGDAAAIGGANPNWTATHTMNASDPEGSVAFTIDFVDAPGNPGVQVTATTDASDVIFDRTGPTVTDGNITITSTPTGTGSVYIIGDTITVQWDNSGTGDGNTDISGATADFTEFAGPPALAMVNASEFYTASYVLVTGTIDTTNLNVSVTATDITSNVSTAADTSNLTVDNLKPTLSAVSIASDNTDPTLAIIDDLITVSFTVAEDISDPPTVTIANKPATIGGSNPNWTASYVIVSADAEGIVPFTINFNDVPGNPGLQVTTVTDGTSVTFDRTGPTMTDANITITSTPTGAGGEYIIGDTITVQWDNSGTGDNNSDINGATANFSAFGGPSASVMSNASEIYTANYVVIFGAVEASNLNVAVTSADNASNETTLVDSTNLELDNRRPTLSPVTIASNNVDPTQADIGDTVTVSFTTSEDIQNPPTATIAGKAATIGGSNPNWTASYVLLGTDAGGNISFTIDFDDIPGNAGNQVTSTTDSSNVFYNNNGPTMTDANVSIISTPSGVGSVYIVNDTITVQWDNSATGDNNVDVLNAKVNFTAFGGPAAALMANASEIYTASYVVVAGTIDATNLNVSVTSTDTSLDSTLQNDTSNLSMDNIIPTLVSINIASNNTNGTLAKVGDTITITFTSDQNLQTPSVTVVGNAAALSGSDTNWTANYTMQSGDAEGAVTFAINYNDTPGNAGVERTAVTDGSSVTFDKTPPLITSVDINAGTYKIGGVANVTITSDAAGYTAGIITINGENLGIFNDVGDNTYTGTYTVIEGNTDRASVGVVPISVILTDPVGNSNTAYTTPPTSGGSVIIDANKPVIQSVSLTPNAGVRNVGDTVDITVTAVGFEVGLTPSDATFNAQTVALTDQGDGTYKGTYTVLEGHSDANNPEATGITLTDVAGNVSAVGASSGNTLTIDANTPTNFKITGSAAQTAGQTNVITVRLFDQFDNQDNFTGGRNVIFSGATASLGGNNPTIDGTNFGVSTLLTFTDGLATANMILYNAEESPTIEVDEGVLYTALSLSVTVSDDAATTISLTAGNGQTATVATTLSAAFVVTVSDDYGNLINGQSVTYAINSEPAGTFGTILSTTDTSTGANGQATSTLTLGDLIGVYEVTATSAGMTGSPITFTTTGIADNAANLSLVSGDAQNAQINTALGNPFIVEVTDQFGNPVESESVTFAFLNVPSGATGQLLSNGATTTDAGGLASSLLTIGDKSGTYEVSAASGILQGSPITFTATGTTASADSISLVSGNSQSATVGTALGSSFIVKVTDSSGNAVSGVSVSFAVTSTPSGATGDSLSVTSTTTDTNGLASTALTLGNLIGTYTVDATSGGLTGSPVTFTATGTADTATTMELVSGNNQSAVILSTLGSGFVVSVKDQYGNPVSSEVVTYAVNTTPSGATGQSLSVSSVGTNTTGQATSVFTLGNLIGTYTVTATSGSLTGSPVTFTITGLIGSIDAVTSTVTALPTSLPADNVAISTVTVTLKDIGSNPISGKSVSLTSSRGATDTISISGTTNASGQITGTVKSSTDGAATILAVGDPSGDNVTLAQTANLLFTAINQNFTVEIEPFHDSTNDAVVMSTSLLRDGALVSDIGNMTLTDIHVANSSGTNLSGNLNGSSDTVTDTLNAVFYTTWDPSAGLTVNIPYTLIAKITYAGNVYSGVKIFSVDQLSIVSKDIETLDQKADQIQTTSDSAETTVKDIDADVASLDAQEVTSEAALEAERTSTLSDLTTLTSSVGAIVEDTEKTIPDQLTKEISDQLAKGVQAEIVTRASTVVTGETVPVRFRSASRLSPKVTIYDSNDVAKITNATMVEIGKTGIYEYKVTFSTDWGTGSFMALVQESTKKSVDSVVFNVIPATGDTTSTSTASSSAVTIDTLFSRMNTVNANVDTIVTNVNAVKDETTGVDKDIDDILKKIDSATTVTSEETMSPEDVAKLKAHLNSVTASIGARGSVDLKTVLGKLGSIEQTLVLMGPDGDAAMAFNENARQKAGNIKQFIELITTELDEEGTVENLEEKMNILEVYLEELRQAVEDIPESVSTDSVESSIEQTLNELSDLASGNDGLVELMALVEQSMEGAEITFTEEGEPEVQEGALSPEEVLEMRNEINALKSLMLEIRGLLDSEVNAPVVHGWLEGE